MLPLAPAETAILAVHLQNDMVSEGGAFTSFFAAELERNDTLAKAAALIGLGCDAGAFIVQARIGFAPDYADLVVNAPLLQIARDSAALVNGTWQTQIADSVAVHPDDLVLTHTRFSPFVGTPLEVILRARGVRNVIVLGVATNASVEDAARAAANLGFRTILASDASSAATIDAHQATLASFGLLGEVATNAEIQDAFEGGAA